MTHDDDTDVSGPSDVSAASTGLRIVLADDQAMVRAGFSMIIDSQSDMAVIGQVDNGEACVEVARRLRPDVVVMDIRMPILDGLAATRRLAGPEIDDPIRVVIATTFDSDDHVETALRNGAVGFILKDGGPEMLLQAVRAAAGGEALIAPAITVRYLDRFISHRAGDDPGTHPLSAREVDVARCVSRGLANREVADELFISLSTVKTHLESIQTKLRLRNRVEVAIWVRDHLSNEP